LSREEVETLNRQLDRTKTERQSLFVDSADLAEQLFLKDKQNLSLEAKMVEMEQRLAKSEKQHKFFKKMVIEAQKTISDKQRMIEDLGTVKDRVEAQETDLSKVD
jgi:chromosome segregation ATPase